MLVDLLATDNMGQYNTKVAQVLGLHSAIYINELLNISNKAHSKGKLYYDKYFLLDRKYITRRTTIENDEQLAIDRKLSQIKVIEKNDGDEDVMLINVEVLASLLSSDDKEKLDKLSKRARVKTAALPGTKLTRQQKLAVELKQGLKCTNPDLKEALEGWIDACQQDTNGKGLTAYKVKVFEQGVDNFAKGDLDIALKVVEIAAVHNYVEVQWAINTFNKNYLDVYKNRKVETNASARRVRVSDEVY